MKLFVSKFMISALLLTIFSSFVCSVYADEIYEGLNYVIDSHNEVTITGGSKALIDIVIPAFIDDRPVTAIGDGAFDQHFNIKSVVIPHGIRTIGYSAFSHCTGLRNISIPGSVLEIGGVAFKDSGLESVSISNGVASIGISAFAHTGLKNVTIPESVTFIGHWAFRNCSLESVIIRTSTAVFEQDIFLEGSKNLTIYAPPNSTAEAYAKGEAIAFKPIRHTKDTASLSNIGNIAAKDIVIADADDNHFDVIAVFERSQSSAAVLLAVYDENGRLINVHLAGRDAVIKNVPADELSKGKLFIWDKKSMEPAIEVLEGLAE